MMITRHPQALSELTTYLLSQVARVAKRRLDDELSERGLRLRHMALLAALADAGESSQLEIGRRLGLDPSDVTSTVDDLEARRWVRRRADADDRRRRLVTLTPAGRSGLVELVSLATSISDALLEPVPPSRRRHLHADLLAVLTSVEERA